MLVIFNRFLRLVIRPAKFTTKIDELEWLHAVDACFCFVKSLFAKDYLRLARTMCALV